VARGMGVAIPSSPKRGGHKKCTKRGKRMFDEMLQAKKLAPYLGEKRQILFHISKEKNREK